MLAYGGATRRVATSRQGVTFTVISCYDYGLVLVLLYSNSIDKEITGLRELKFLNAGMSM